MSLQTPNDIMTPDGIRVRLIINEEPRFTTLSWAEYLAPQEGTQTVDE